MSTKSSTLTATTSNTSFEELYNLLYYKSHTTSIEKLTFSQKTSKDKFYYSGFRVIHIPFSHMISDAPDKIKVRVNGWIDTVGNSETFYIIPPEYENYCKGYEKICITSDGNIKIELKYQVMESNKSDSYFDYFKNKAYNTMISTIEEHIITLYNSKRPLCFNLHCDREIKNIEDFSRCLM